jgi:tetratricopeptide (TPR) repeat protein
MELLRQAEQLLAQAEQLREDLARSFPENAIYQSQLALTYRELGNLHDVSDDLRKADAYYQTYLNIHQRLADRYPEVPEYKEQLKKTKAFLRTRAIYKMLRPILPR